MTLVVTVAGCADYKRPARFDLTAPPSTADTASRDHVTTTVTPAAPLTPTDASDRVRPGDYTAVDALKPVHFEFDRVDVRSPDLAILDRNAGWLLEHPKARVLIEAHADERGTGEYNVALSDTRAKTTRSYLISKGVRGERVATIAYGEERPLCAESTEACWARNRRASFLVRPE
jgi:peptidoglycan-associated lipoprotein